MINKMLCVLAEPRIPLDKQMSNVNWEFLLSMYSPLGSLFMEIKNLLGLATRLI